MTFLTTELKEVDMKKAHVLVEANKQLASKERRITNQARAIVRLKEKLSLKSFIIESK